MIEVQEWEAEVVDLKMKGLDTKDIAEALDKHPATIRKAVARARDRGALPDDRVLSEEEAAEAFAPIPGQTTVDDFTQTCEHGIPWNSPEEPACTTCSRDPLDDFRAEAGEATGELQERPGEETPDVGEVTTVTPPLRGTAQLCLDFGPNAAPVTSATIVFKSEKLASGYFEMGDVIEGRFTARITGMTGAEKFDKDMGDYVAKPQAHTATITEITLDVGEAA